ncbi:MAG: hypothetical protein KC731_22435, partial [Myxococcales bacterium]|nr:hypothetical protein [Myxococcales bacterium]
EGRQNLTKNYLIDAKQAGAQFRAGHEVTTIEPTSDGYVLHGTRRVDGGEEPFDLECRLLVLAAGSIASTGLLLRSRDLFPTARDLDPGGLLGREVSGNGDYGVSGIVGADYEHLVEGHKGKPMSSFCPTFFAEHQFILIPFYAPLLYMTLGQPTHLLRAADPLALGRRSTTPAKDAQGRVERDWGIDYKRRLKQFGPRMLTMGCLALDEGEAEITLDAQGATTVRWPDTHPATEARWSAAADAMRRIYDSLGGEMYLDSYRDTGTVNTAHPLGGCRMAEADDETQGVVDPFGESFRNRNLFVVDGAIIPSALGVNPSLTIAAVAERIAEQIVMGSGTESFASRLG